jgi:hypothetical protein
MVKPGKKTKAWAKAKPGLIKIYEEKGITRCEISNSGFALGFHHIDKRSSLKAEHTFEGTRLLNQDWHTFCEYNDEANELLRNKPRGFDKLYFEKFKEMFNKKKETPKGKKSDWRKPHQCVSCKKTTGMLICEYCKQFSIKI